MLFSSSLSCKVVVILGFYLAGGCYDECLTIDFFPIGFLPKLTGLFELGMSILNAIYLFFALFPASTSCPLLLLCFPNIFFFIFMYSMVSYLMASLDEFEKLAMV